MLIEGLSYEWDKEKRHIRFIVTDEFEKFRGNYHYTALEGFEIGSSSHPDVEMGYEKVVYVWLPGIDTHRDNSWVSYVDGLKEALASVGVFSKRKVKVSLYGRSSV